MSAKRNLTPLLVGLALVATGSLFLAANLIDFRFDWVRWLQFVLPVLLIAWGLAKLARHFAWDAPQLSQYPSKGGLLSGLFWVFLGSVWLLDLAGILEGLSFFGLYWPAILVLFGLGKIIDYYRLRGQLQFRTAELIGILFVILVGISAKSASETHLPLLRIPISFPSDARGIRIGEYLGQKYTWTKEATFPANGVNQVEVVNIYGNVTVTEGSSEEIKVRLTKEIFESSESDARRIADQIEIKSEPLEGGIKIGTNRADLPATKSRFNSHLEINVPKAARVKVSNEYGDVRVARLDGQCWVENSYGEVVIEEIGADVDIKNQYRQTSASRISGNLKIANQRGEVVAEEISGNVELGTERDALSASRVLGNAVVRNRFGTVKLENIQGTVRVEGQGSSVNLQDIGKEAVVENSYKPFQANDLKAGLQLETSNSRVELTRVSGAVSISADQSKINAQELEAGVTVKGRGTEVTLSEIEGGFNVATSLRAVSVESFSGRGEVQNEYGEISIASNEPLEEPLNVSNKYGRITLALPTSAKFRLSAQAPGGSISSDFNPQVESTAEAASILESTIGGGGPQVRLQTTYSDIRIRKN